MPEHRLEKTRRAYGPDEATWRRPSDNAAAQLERRGCTHDRARYDYMIRAYRCACGKTFFSDAANASRVRHWNTIEVD